MSGHPVTITDTYNVRLHIKARSMLHAKDYLTHAINAFVVIYSWTVTPTEMIVLIDYTFIINMLKYVAPV